MVSLRWESIILVIVFRMDKSVNSRLFRIFWLLFR